MLTARFIAHDVAASPWFSIPLDITTVNPVFESCSIWYNGAWDPPQTLVKESSMVPGSSNSVPPPTSRAAPGAQVTPTLAPATTIIPINGPSQSSLAEPKKPSTASAIEQDPQLEDLEKTMDNSEPPTETRVPRGTVRIPLFKLQTQATSAAAPAAGAVASQPSGGNSWPSSDPPSNPPASGLVASQPSDGKPWPSSHHPQDPPTEATKTSGPAVLVSPPKADNPSDSETEGVPPEEIILTTYASSPGRESGVPTAVGYLPILKAVSAGSSMIDSDVSAFPISASPLQSLILDPNVQGSNGGAVFPSTTMLPFTWASNGDVSIASSTITVGNQAVIDGHVFSVGISSVAVDGIPYSPPSQMAQTPPPVPISGNPISTGPNGDIVIATSTIAVGDQATVYGHVLSAGSSAIVMDGSTYARSFSAGAVSQQTGSSENDLASTMAGAMTGSSIGLGGLILSGFADGLNPTSVGSALSGSSIATSTDSVAIGSSTPESSVDLASGSNLSTYTGACVKAGIDVRLWSLTVVVNAIGLALVFL